MLKSEAAKQVVLSLHPITSVAQRKTYYKLSEHIIFVGAKIAAAMGKSEVFLLLLAIGKFPWLSIKFSVKLLFPVTHSPASSGDDDDVEKKSVKIFNA